MDVHIRVGQSQTSANGRQIQENNSKGKFHSCSQFQFDLVAEIVLRNMHSAFQALSCLLLHLLLRRGRDSYHLLLVIFVLSGLSSAFARQVHAPARLGGQPHASRPLGRKPHASRSFGR